MVDKRAELNFPGSTWRDERDAQIGRREQLLRSVRMPEPRKFADLDRASQILAGWEPEADEEA